jgi:geranylgeranyl reductase family protein
MPQKKIVVIGAGPIGCFTAQALKIYGFEPLLVEEHAEIGRPIHCTGLVGHKVFAEKRLLALPKSSVINVINGAVIHYESHSFTIQRQEVAYVIDREQFDKGLSQGLDILYQNKFLGIEKAKEGYVIGTDKEEITADIVIGADGANSTVRRILGQDKDIIFNKGLQFRLRAKPRHHDLVEMYLKPSSFFWVVPETEDVLRVGTISENPYNALQDFLKEIKFKGELLERFGGVVATGICKETVKANIALVGDAACQVKPLTYGGIYFGLKAASILAGCIKEGCLENYDALWKKELTKEIKIGLKAKEIYSRLNNEELKAVFYLLRSQKKLIEKSGDFENHSGLILEIIKKPSLYTQLGEFLRILFKKIL